MDIDALTANIKPFDLTVPPALSADEQNYFRHYNLNIEEKYPNVTHYFGHFSAGHFDIIAHYFKNESAVQTCFILHGYFDHSGLYGHVINYCIEHNLSVVIYDLPGHGLSTGKPACIGDFSDYQTVLRAVLDQFSPSVPKPWHVIAQSTGAAVLMDYVLNNRDNEFSKIILLAPLVRPVKWTRGLFAYYLVKFFVDHVPRAFSINSSDNDFVAFLAQKDPLQARYVSVRWVGALKNWITRFKHFQPSEQAPLIIQGQNDGTVDWQYNIVQIRNKFPNAKVLYLQHARHHLANESEEIREKIFSAIDMYLCSTAQLSKP